MKLTLTFNLECFFQKPRVDDPIDDDTNYVKPRSNLEGDDDDCGYEDDDDDGDEYEQHDEDDDGS